MNKLKTAEPARAMCSPGRTHRTPSGWDSLRIVRYGLVSDLTIVGIVCRGIGKAEGQDAGERDETQEHIQKNAGSILIDSVLDTCYFYELYDYRKMRTNGIERD